MPDNTFMPKIYREPGGSRQVVKSGGSLDIESGGEIDIESGGSLKLAGTAITATAAEINALASTGLDSTELGYLNGVTAGTVTASKALVVDSNKRIDTLVVADSGLKLGTSGGTAIDATALEINRAADVSTRLVAAGATLSATVAAHADRIVVLDTLAGSVVTLPAATGTGAVFTFVVGVLATSNSHIVKVANSSDIIQGAVLVVDTDTAGTVTGFATAADSDTITLNRSTTGSVIRGERIDLIDYATNLWLASGILTNTGNGATPFSATV